jgi:N-acetylmuramic acid 6-phosphate etherase
MNNMSTRPSRALNPESEPGIGNPQSSTEARNPATENIDTLPTLDMVRLMNTEDARAPQAIASELPHIAEAIDRIAERMRPPGDGRLIYVGAGTSGRLGVLDASECPPTFGIPPELVVGLIAGGEHALTHAVEGAEDDTRAGARDVAALNVSERDSVIGIAASGRTPYVLGGMAEARKRGAFVVSLACNRPSPMEEMADVSIAPLTGPEVLTGSTRLKAGTAQKLVLNMISTGVMIRLGKTYSNLMVNVQATNVKLQARARRIVEQACGLTPDEAVAALEACGELKTAIVSTLSGVSPDEAQQRLDAAGGIVRKALSKAQDTSNRGDSFLVGVDGGGSKTVALLSDLEGRVLGRGLAGSSNYQVVGMQVAGEALNRAIRAAFADAKIEPCLPGALCLGLAGVDRPEDCALIRAWADEHLPGTPVEIVNDAQLVLATGTPEGWGVATICGTGSIVHGRNRAGQATRVDGWGHLLGDDSSGYAIGRAALRAIMRAQDGRGPQTQLARLILEHWSLDAPEDLVRRVYTMQASTQDIAALAELVDAAALAGDLVAQSILKDAGREQALAVAAVAKQLQMQGTIPCAQGGSVIVKGHFIRQMFLDSAAALGLQLDPVTPVPEPAQGALRLARRLVSSATTQQANL